MWENISVSILFVLQLNNTENFQVLPKITFGYTNEMISIQESTILSGQWELLKRLSIISDTKFNENLFYCA